MISPTLSLSHYFPLPLLSSPYSLSLSLPITMYYYYAYGYSRELAQLTKGFVPGVSGTLVARY